MINIHLITSLESGGVQKSLMNYLESIDSKLLKNIMVFSLKGHDFYSEKIVNIGVKVYHLNKLKNWLMFLRYTITAQGYLKAWMYHACVLSIIFKINPTKKVFWSIHHGRLDKKTDSSSTTIAAYLSAALSWLVPKKVIFVSKDCRKAHLKFGFRKSNSDVIYNYVQFPYELYKTKEPKSITFIGRDHPNKNLNLFLEACKEIEQLCPDSHFIIAGKNTDLRKEKFNFGTRYSFLGEVQNIQNVYSETEIYVCTSYIESFGLTIIEALFNKCKVVCPDANIFREVTNDLCCYYQQNNLKSLVDAIISSREKEQELIRLEVLKSKYSKSKTIFRLANLLGDI